MALISPEFDVFFLRTVETLEAYLGQVVIAGGCANALYRYCPGARRGPTPLTTFDVDVVTPNRFSGTQQPLGDSLASGGLSPVSTARETNKYSLSPDAVEKLELLCPLAGLPTRLKDDPPVLVPVEPGAVAEALDFVDILLVHPLAVDLRSVPGLSVTSPVEVRIPHPVLYVVQKALIRNQRRGNQQRAKDSYYTFEVAYLFRDSLSRLVEEAASMPRPVTRKRLRSALGVLDGQFAHVGAEGVLQAVDVANDSGQRILPETVFRTTQSLIGALTRVLGL